LIGQAGDDSKAEYRFFKRDVLHKAIAEINACTNIEVSGPIEHKEKDNRTIAEIQFEVHHKPTSAGPSRIGRMDGIVVDDLPAIGRAINLGVGQAEAEDLIKRYGVQRFETALDELDRRQRMPSEKVGAVLKPGSWLRAHMSRQVSEPEPPAPGTEIGAAELQKRRAAWTDEWLRRRKERLRSGFLELGAQEQAAHLEAFRSALKAGSHQQVLKRFDDSGWQHRMVLGSFIVDDILAIAAEAAAAPQRGSA
jgi:hypothetical protein